MFDNLNHYIRNFNNYAATYFLGTDICFQNKKSTSNINE